MAATEANKETTRARHAGKKRPFKKPLIPIVLCGQAKIFTQKIKFGLIEKRPRCICGTVAKEATSLEQFN